MVIEVVEVKSTKDAPKSKFGIVILALLVAAAAVILGLNMKQLQKRIYKTNNDMIVRLYAEKYNLDPYFIFAVIKTESDFKEDAVSDVGARGLMQVMPDTFKWIHTKVKKDNVTFDDMFTPENNIAYGGYLLGYLMEEFHNEEEALAAYHAGRGAVNGWLSDEKYSTDGKNLSTIPIADTAHYVEKVMKNYENYLKIYSD